MSKQLPPFDFWSEEKAMAHTPYDTVKLFRRHYGDLFRSEKDGEKGGYLASDLQARTETFPTRPRK